MKDAGSLYYFPFCLCYILRPIFAVSILWLVLKNLTVLHPVKQNNKYRRGEWKFLRKSK
jgi:fumarate reductase subunit C